MAKLFGIVISWPITVAAEVVGWLINWDACHVLCAEQFVDARPAPGFYKRWCWSQFYGETPYSDVLAPRW